MAGVKTRTGRMSREGLMTFIREFEDENHYLPNIAEMSRATGIFRTAVVWHLDKLREEGVVTFVDGNLARTLRLL